MIGIGGYSGQRRFPMRWYSLDRAILMFGWLVLVLLWLGFEWLANVFSINKWVMEIIGFSVVGYLVYHFLLKGSRSRMTPDTNEEKNQRLEEKFCLTCGNLMSVRVTKDHKIVVYCPKCGELVKSTDIFPPKKDEPPW